MKPKLFHRQINDFRWLSFYLKAFIHSRLLSRSSYYSNGKGSPTSSCSLTFPFVALVSGGREWIEIRPSTAEARSRDKLENIVPREAILAGAHFTTQFNFEPNEYGRQVSRILALFSLATSAALDKQVSD